MKRSLILGIILIALFAVWLTCSNILVPITDLQFRKKNDVFTASQLQSEEKARISRQSSQEQLFLVEAKEEPYVVDYVTVARSSENLPYRFVGGQTTPGKVIDHEGHVLIESGREIVIDDAVVGPNKKQLLVKGAEGNNLILTPATGEKLVLPLRPSGANMFPFSWDWIGERSLLGISGVERLGPDGKPTKSEANVAESKLYVYDLKTQQLSEVALPDKFSHAVFGVIEVIPDGHVYLALEGSEYKNWCKIVAP